MVRFKLAKRDREKVSRALFQFHDGSIQALHTCEPFDIPGDVSIPRWFDSSLAYFT